MKKIYIPGFLFIFSCLSLFAQERNITGMVTSADDHSPVPGVSVVVKGTTNGTVTDLNGRFEIKIFSAADSLVFSSVGMESQTISTGIKNTFDISLKVKSHKLEEVVVTALGIKREKKALGYSVQEVSGTELQTAKDPSFVNQLAGKVAGLNISTTTGGPGSSSRIVLRGATSLTGGNQALIVIDGIPMENNTNNNTSQWGGRDYGNGISDINPDDIERISVLKGPTAAALYGSLATNGVILITTKKGKSGKGIAVSFNSSTSVESAYIHEKFQNTYGAGRNGKFAGQWVMGIDSIPTYNTAIDAVGSWGPKMEGQKIRDWDGQIRNFNPQPDNYKDFFQTGLTTNNSVSLEGGSKKITWRGSAGYMTVKDIVPNTTLKRTNLSARGIAELTSRLTLDVSISYVNQLANNRLGLADSRSVARNYVMMPRSISLESLQGHIMDASGKETTWYSAWNWMTNPFWDIQYELNDDSRDRVIAMGSATYKLTEHLNALLRTTTDFNTQVESSREASYGLLNYSGSYSNTKLNHKQYQSDFLITYSDKINADLSWNGNIGGSTFETHDDSNHKNTRSGLIVPYEYTIENSVNYPDTSTRLYESRINGLYAFGQIAYKSFLFLDVTARNDWSSKLPKENRSYFYPSVSSGFVFTDAFHIKENILSFGKLRASWAMVGRDPDQPYLESISYPYVSSFNGAPMYQVVPLIPLTNLKPELTSHLEVGTELMFFTGRIRLDFAYYTSDTRNETVTADISPASGFPQAVINSGEIKNKGIEIILKTTPVAAKNFKWDVNINYAHNENTVVSLTEGLESRQLLSDWNLTIEARPGHPYGDIVGYAILRDGNGNKLVDTSGFYLRDPNPRVLGNINPKFLGGILNQFTYKNISLSFLVDARVGGQMFSGTNMYGDGYSGNLVETLPGREGGILAEGVTPDGKPNKKYISAQDYWSQFATWTKEIHEPFVYDAGYVKLREVTFGYEFSEQLCRKIKLKGLSVALTGRNLWLIYSGAPNIDPESEYTNGNGQGYEKYSYPTRRSIGINVKIKI
ncbi:MAG: SusC/RagA family TonB-linked outer membrane protein [Bacteroidetes bacterium]|nr:SusC/RagA family TonB-linked outer membrane protein [Bacteroidota bacterium]